MGQGADNLNGNHKNDWLVLVPKGHVYKKVISDLSGFDPKEHECTPESLVPSVMSWLATRPDSIKTPSSKKVLSRLCIFNRNKQKLTNEWNGQPLWGDIVICAFNAARPIIKELPKRIFLQN